jgi:hypothetical protein
VTDDFGNVFRRGEPAPLNVHDWQVLSKSAAAAAFLFLKPGEVSKPEEVIRLVTSADCCS